MDEDADALEIRVEALELLTERLLAVIAQHHLAEFDALETAVVRRWTAEAPKDGAMPDQRAWRVLTRALEALQQGRSQPLAARLDGLFDQTDP